MEFKGQVKISDVQQAFDELIDKINYAIDIYNEASEASGVTLSKGAPYLAPSGYSLSLGGLKKVLQAYNGCIIGCHVWRLSEDKFAVTRGMIIKDGRVEALPQGIITGDMNGKYLYLDTEHDEYVASVTKIDDSDYLFIRNINLKRDMNVCDTSSNYALNDNLKIFVGDNALDMNTNNYSDSYRPCFVSASGGVNNWGAVIYFLGIPIQRILSRGIHKEKFMFAFYRPLYLPKNVSNPFSGDFPCMKSFEAIIE